MIVQFLTEFTKGVKAIHIVSIFPFEVCIVLFSVFAYSDMAADPDKRKRFIESAVNFCQKHNFDGIDLMWMHPGIEWRDGVPEDKHNLVEIREAFR